jgi:amino acid transporter
MDRVFTQPLLPGGWSGVLAAVPYALWWLVIIETVALASEEAHEPHVSIPRGMVLAQITLVVLVVLTWFFACAAAPYGETGAVVYPLPLVVKNVWGTGWFLTGFSILALAGMVVSYNGMIYATSRQSFSLGRAGYLPSFLGSVHATRRTPHASLAVWTAVTIAFILFGHFYEQATAVAILISTLTAVIWYVLAVVCLVVLRRKEPGLVRPYKAPLYPWMPIFVAVLSAIAGCLYGWVNVQVLVPAALLYVAAGIWYGVWARKKVLSVAPEEVAARIAQRLARREETAPSGAVAQKGPVVVSRPTGPILMPTDPLYRRQAQVLLERLTGPTLLLGVLSLVWMILRAVGLVRPMLAEAVEISLVVAVWTGLFALVTAVGFLSTRRNSKIG